MVAGTQERAPTDAREIADDVAVGEDAIEVMSQRQLIWRRFKRHRLAMFATFVVALLYTAVPFADFYSSNDPREHHDRRGYMPPQGLRLFDGWKPDLHVCEQIRTKNEFLKIEYEPNCATKVDVRFFGKGYTYKLLGLEIDRHLFTVEEPYVIKEGSTLQPADQVGGIYLLGTDVQGRDMYSRMMHGARLSLLIGLAGIFIALAVGVVLGAVSGFYGGFIDNLIQRSIEIIRSIPTVPLYLGLAAAFPADWSVERRFFAITIVVSLFAWTELARVVRGRFLAMRQEDFVTAAITAGASQRRIIFRHMLPSFYSHIIAASTLSLAFMVISETTLSFLGLGLQAPAISLGVLLFAAQNIQSVLLAPWLLIPGVVVVILVLCLNFMGDGIRDAADPYGS